MVAITRDVSPAFAECELTHFERVPIDLAKAGEQHHLYICALEQAGYRVQQLPASSAMPDCVFVEDTAVVLDEVAVIMRPGAASRRGEVAAIAEALAALRTLSFIEAPATIDGGDVLIAGRQAFVGRSTRTTADAVAQLRNILAPHGYTVCEIPVDDCLHLKSAVTCVDEGVLLLNPAWVPLEAFRGFELVMVDERESYAANGLRLRDRVMMPAAFPRTAERLAARGLNVVSVDVSELAKAEGAVTCCSLLIDGV